MKHPIALVTLALSSTLVLAACPDDTASDEFAIHDQPMSSGNMNAERYDHPRDGGAPPAGIAVADNPTYPLGIEVILMADHMPGTDGATARISSAFDTTTYSVSYTPAGGEPITDHRWIVPEELVDPGEAPLPEGTEVILDAEHMQGMKGAEATSTTQQKKRCTWPIWPLVV
ncbi:hypothetical protein COCCU_06305 [Corynebacterium occultum]|uniref:DUF1541 domain-containing protein n=1 Tax=Corynebacterium occultum TaxID=2675219 RepID=A0A6B8WB09_9CORY|nr:hypothetical protein COCCU_06305 [Corynebacterium occultum]